MTAGEGSTDTHIVRGAIESRHVIEWLIDFPFLRDNIVFVAHDELNGPDSQSEENVHPSPPYLRGVIQH